MSAASAESAAPGPVGSRDRPLVSIVVPVLNGERFLRESLDSIAAQTYAPLELIVMDDCSTDGTARVVAEYGDRVAHHVQPTTRGQFANVNDGIAAARGEYVCVYHADDVYEPEIVEREVEYLEAHPEAGVVFAVETFIDEHGTPYGRLELPEELVRAAPLDYAMVLEKLLHKCSFMSTPSGMVRASVYREVGPYDDSFGIASDLDMWVRIARSYRIGIVHEHLYRYRRGHGSSSDRHEPLRTEPEGHFRIVDRELARGGRRLVSARALDAYEGHRAEDKLKTAAGHYILGDRTAARDALRDASLRRIVASRLPRRGWVIAFHLSMTALIALPRLAPAAAFLRWRVYSRPPWRARHRRLMPRRLRALIVHGPADEHAASAGAGFQGG